jgi:hypothetical protein
MLNNSAIEALETDPLIKRDLLETQAAAKRPGCG